MRDNKIDRTAGLKLNIDWRARDRRVSIPCHSHGKLLSAWQTRFRISVMATPTLTRLALWSLYDEKWATYSVLKSVLVKCNLWGRVWSARRSDHVFDTIGRSDIRLLCLLLFFCRLDAKMQLNREMMLILSEIEIAICADVFQSVFRHRSRMRIAIPRPKVVFPTTHRPSGGWINVLSASSSRSDSLSGF